MQLQSMPPTAAAAEPLNNAQQLQPAEDAFSPSAASMPSVTPVPQGLNTMSSAAYTCVAPAQRGWADGLVAGTASGRLRWLDLERGCSCADVYCHPISRWQVRVFLINMRKAFCSLPGVRLRGDALSCQAAMMLPQYERVSGSRREAEATVLTMAWPRMASGSGRECSGGCEPEQRWQQCELAGRWPVWRACRLGRPSHRGAERLLESP